MAKDDSAHSSPEHKSDSDESNFQHTYSDKHLQIHPDLLQPPAAPKSNSSSPALSLSDIDDTSQVFPGRPRLPAPTHSESSSSDDDQAHATDNSSVDTDSSTSSSPNNYTKDTVTPLTPITIRPLTRTTNTKSARRIRKKLMLQPLVGRENTKRLSGSSKELAA